MIETGGGKLGGRQRQISVVENEKDERRVCSVHRVPGVPDLHCKSSLGSLNQIRLAAASTANLDLSLSALAFNPGDARHWLSIENHPPPPSPLESFTSPHPPLFNPLKRVLVCLFLLVSFQVPKSFSTPFNDAARIIIDTRRVHRQLSIMNRAHGTCLLGLIYRLICIRGIGAKQASIVVERGYTSGRLLLVSWLRTHDKIWRTEVVSVSRKRRAI